MASNRHGWRGRDRSGQGPGGALVPRKGGAAAGACWTALLLVPSFPSNAAVLGARAAFSSHTNTSAEFDAYEGFVVFDLPWSWERNRWETRAEFEVAGGVIELSVDVGR